jgi:hypothetical protein
MGVKWSRPEVSAERGSAVTLGQMEELVMAARMAGAPDDAELGVDCKMEIRSPIRVIRAVFEWDGLTKARS